MSPRATRWLMVVSIIVVLALAGWLIYEVTRPAPPPPKPKVAQPELCQPDPAAYIAALHPTPADPSPTFSGHGCYTTLGITVPSGVTIDGGVYESTNTRAPVIDSKATTGVTVEDVTTIGGDPSGTYVPANVQQAGIELQSTTGTKLVDDATENTWGDGLELWTDEPTTGKNVGQLTVDGYTVTQAGRQCVTFGFTYNVTMTGVNCVSQADDAFDFESDLPGIGNGYVTVTDSSGRYWSDSAASLGPITFTDDHISELVWDSSAANGYPVTFTGGTMVVQRSPHGRPGGQVTASNHASLTLSSVAVSSLPGSGAIVGCAWKVVGDSHLTLANSPIATPPRGCVDPGSTLTVTP